MASSKKASLPVDASTRRRPKQAVYTEDYYGETNLRRSGSSKSVLPSSYNSSSGGGRGADLGYNTGFEKPYPDTESNMSPTKATAACNNFPNWDSAIVVHKARNVYMEKSANPNAGLGFSIRGGSEHGIGIYVSYVEGNSVAERQGLVIGDQILALNGVKFTRISHEEAAIMIRSAASLDMDVRSVGRVPGSIESLQTYSWVNPRGHMVSPPLEVDRVGRYEASAGMSGKRPVMLLKDADERKINLMLHADARLGFMIRGGNEFGLGVYITGVDRHSLSESAGLKPGDQILDVNGHSFLDISHSEAVKVLKSSRHLIMTVKDVGKIPHSRIMYDQTQWMRGEQMLSRSPESGSSSNPRFVKGAGSQMMHSSVSNQKTQWGLINERAQQVLSTEERELLVYYLKGYEGRHITVHALALGIAELLDSPSKSSLIDEIRGMIKPQDLEVFDHMVLKKEGPPKQMADDTDEVFRAERSVKRPHKHKRVQGRQTRSPSDDSGVDVNNGEHFQRYPAEQHHSPYMAHDALDGYSRTGQVTASSTASASSKQGTNGHKTAARRTHQNGASPPNYVKGSRRSSDEYELWTERQSKGEVFEGQQYQYSDGYEDLEALDYHMHPEKNDHQETQYGPNGGRSISKKPSKRQLMRGNSLDCSHFYGAEVRFKISEGSATGGNKSNNYDDGGAYGGEYSSGTGSNNNNSTNSSKPAHRQTASSDYDVRPRQGILKGSSSGRGGSERMSTTRQRRERVPHIKIQDWEEVEKELPVAAKEQSGPQQQHTQSCSGGEASSSSTMTNKRVTKRTQQKYRLTMEELEMLRLKVREKLAEVERIKEQRSSPSKQDRYSPNKTNVVGHNGGDGGSSPRGISSSSLSKASKRSTNDVVTTSINSDEHNNGHGEITMRNQTIAKFVDDGSDAHLYGQNWDDARAQILRKKGKPLEIPRSSDSETSLNSLALGSEKTIIKGQDEGDVTLIEGDYSNGGSLGAGDMMLNSGLVKKQMRKITMYKRKPTLGLAIEGGGSTKQPLPRIVNIQENGCAYDCDLAKGQLILEVNGRCLRELSHRECAQAIAEAFRDAYVDKVDFLIVDKSASNRTEL